MSPTFTTDEIGKVVESATGEQLGVVTAVDRETAYVDLESRLTESTRVAFGWIESTEDVAPLAGDAVDRITDEAVRLEATVPDDSAGEDGPPNAAVESGAGGDLGSLEEGGRRGLEADPTELTDRDPEAELRPDEDPENG